jgi:VPDSG-CTERM motif
MAARLMSALFLAGAFVLVSAARSEAALIVYVCDDANCSGGANFTIADNSAADTDPDLGQVSIQQPGFTGTLTANTKPALGSATAPALNLTYTLGPAAFTAFPTPFLFAAEDGFTAGGTATFQANATFLSGGTASLFSGPGTFIPVPAVPTLNCPSIAAPGCTMMGPVGAVTPYYLALRVGPTPNATGFASGDASVQVAAASVPDGGSTAALLGSVLVGFGLLRRRFSKV